MKKLGKIYLGLVLLFLYIPIFVLIVFSFNETKSRAVFTGFTFDWYARLFHNRVIISSLFNTLIISACASVISTVMGTFAALGISRMKKLPQNFILGATNIPNINPEIVTGVSLMLLFVFFSARMHFEFGFMTLLIAHITFDVPIVVLSVMPKLAQMDPYIYEAALDLGCSPLRAFRKVVLPEILPGVLSGFLMAFTYSLDDFVISYFTTGSTMQTLPITIYSMTRRKISPEINALSTLIFVVVILILIIRSCVSRSIEKRRESE